MSVYGENGQFELQGNDEETFVDLYHNTAGNDEEGEEKPTDKFISFIYSQADEVRAPTLEKMNPKTYQLYQIIQTQILNPENPIALLAQRFTFQFIKHYTNQLLFDEKTGDYYLIQSPYLNNEIRYVPLDMKTQMEATSNFKHRVSSAIEI